MDKRVIFAVAGSGKTSYIIEKINHESRTLIVTYTENNTLHIKKRILEKLGAIPSGVRIYSYFTFIYTFCFRPILGHKIKTKGINFEKPLHQGKPIPNNCIQHYIDKKNRIYSNRIAKILIEKGAMIEVANRINEFFDLICVDEVQDFAANDFNLLCELAKFDINILLVDDFYQHTFDTSRDGPTRKTLHDNYKKYCEELKKSKYIIDEKTLSNSYRCSPTVCRFVTEKLKINIQSNRTDEKEVLLIEDNEKIKDIYSNESVVKLFYQKSNEYTGNTANWGNTKGLDHFDDVCVVLNNTSMNAFQNEKLHELPAMTKNKLYVACTRAKGNLYFIPESMVVTFKKPRQT